eukprot:scaffold980_cov248-Pinguiococcus_pyrenoidosus.AAC.7
MPQEGSLAMDVPGELLHQLLDLLRRQLRGAIRRARGSAILRCPCGRLGPPAGKYLERQIAHDDSCRVQGSSSIQDVHGAGDSSRIRVRAITCRRRRIRGLDLKADLVASRVLEEIAKGCQHRPAPQKGKIFLRELRAERSDGRTSQVRGRRLEARGARRDLLPVNGLGCRVQASQNALEQILVGDSRDRRASKSCNVRAPKQVVFCIVTPLRALVLVALGDHREHATSQRPKFRHRREREHVTPGHHRRHSPDKDRASRAAAEAKVILASFVIRGSARQEAGEHAQRHHPKCARQGSSFDPTFEAIHVALGELRILQEPDNFTDGTIRISSVQRAFGHPCRARQPIHGTRSQGQQEVRPVPHWESDLLVGLAGLLSVLHRPLRHARRRLPGILHRFGWFLVLLAQHELDDDTAVIEGGGEHLPPHCLHGCSSEAQHVAQTSALKHPLVQRSYSLLAGVRHQLLQGLPDAMAEGLWGLVLLSTACCTVALRKAERMQRTRNQGPPLLDRVEVEAEVGVQGRRKPDRGQTASEHGRVEPSLRPLRVL